MGDLLGFLGTIFILLSGGAQIISEIASTVENWVSVQWKKAERKFVPAFAKISRNAIIWTAVIMDAAVLGSALLLYPENPFRFIAAHPWTAVFLIVAHTLLFFRFDDLGAAIAKELPPNANGEEQLEPDMIGEDEVTNPLAGQRRIDERAFKPGKLKIISTTLLIAFALFGTSISLSGVASATKNSLVAVIAAALFLFGIAALEIVAKGGAWLSSKGTLAAAFAANLGFLHAAPILYGVTKENFQKFFEASGIDTEKAINWVNARFEKILAYIALLQAINIAWPNAKTGALTLSVAAALYFAGIFNGHHNPLDEEKLKADFARFFRRAIFWFCAVTMLAWQALPFEWQTSLSNFWDRWNAIILGKTCVPIETSWWAFIGFALAALALAWIYARTKSRWFLIPIGTLITIFSLTSLWEAVEIIGTKAGKERHMAFCSPLGERPTFTKDWKIASEPPTVLTRTEEIESRNAAPRSSPQPAPSPRHAPRRTARAAEQAFDSRPVPGFEGLSHM